MCACVCFQSYGGGRGAGEGVGLTAGAATVHGQGLKHHLVEEQCHGLVVQVVPQQKAIVVDVASLARDRHSLGGVEVLRQGSRTWIML